MQMKVICFFYEEIEEKDHVVLQTGDFAVFFPWELHRPGCSTKNGMQEVQKNSCQD